MIRTKLHILASNVDPKDMSIGKDNKIVQSILNAASFVVDREVLDIVMREDGSKSINAMIEAGIARLPYNPMVVEFEMHPQHHEFVMLREATDGCIYGRVVLMDNENDTAMMALEEIRAEIKDGKMMMHEGVFGISAQGKPFMCAFAIGISIALLMLNTKGIEKEVIRVAESLNKKRVAHGKPRIPQHTVVHIGKIYQRDGTAIHRGAGGWHMPMHWRCGYTRKQRFGKEWEDERLVYIAPCIVNFKPDEAAPHAPQKKIKV